MIFFLCLWILLILLCFEYNIKWTKQDLADYYGICKKTLAKWVRYCSSKFDAEKWKRIRKLNVFELFLITDEFGILEDNKVMTKGEIIEKCESFYHTMRENMAINYKKLGISKEAYSNLDIFPPKLSLRMIEVMG